MHPPGADQVLVRHGDIGIKSEQVRRSMEGQLRDNLAAAIQADGIDGRVVQERTRLYIRQPAVADSRNAVEVATDAATRVFGVVSASPALRVDPTLEAITDGLADSARELYDGGPFAVRARRAGDTDAHPFGSPDIEEAGGTAIWETAEAAGHDPEVDLENPELTFYVECRSDDAYLFVEKRSGPGGLPLGTQAPLVVLVSGGIDSPVAAWNVMRRGSPIIPVYVDLGDYGGPDHQARAAATVGSLGEWAPGQDLTLHVAPGGDIVAELAESMGAMRMLSLRRFMYRVGATVARRVGAAGIVSGEALGQKSSQTAANLSVTSAATSLPIHRPLLSMDKPEIEAQAREIGTYDDATIDAGCNRVAPSFPETRAELSTLEAAEPDDLLDRAEDIGAQIQPPP